ncbi:hypothetical protein HPP92_025521 [Vanilla planifolia]|uniref:Uncharacterized protein n=1 Tax=Vanilla planifolia TaxID=51239 RepID=A0A835PMG5_VANPL|nr:hypothetical protein HPP92_025521 [Vanilla planifolia]
MERSMGCEMAVTWDGAYGSVEAGGWRAQLRDGSIVGASSWIWTKISCSSVPTLLLSSSTIFIFVPLPCFVA